MVAIWEDGPLRQFEVSLTRLEDALHWIGCAALVLIAVLVNIDIVGRILFRSPLLFQFEMVEFYLMPAVAILSLSRVFREGGHLALEFVDPHVFGRLWPLVRALMLLLSAAFFAVTTFISGRYALQAILKGDVYFGSIDWPIGWAFALVPLGCGVLTVRLLFEITKRSAENASSPSTDPSTV